MNAEGWYVDPYGLHDARWFSNGDPTTLVRDGVVESHDSPPSTPYAGQLEPIVERAPSDLDGWRRADDEAYRDAAFDTLDESSGQD